MDNTCNNYQITTNETLYIGNYRPITISTTHSKLVEMLMFPADTCSDNQFGFREKRGTAFGATPLNDVASYFRNNESPLYMCSLDAEKCFDSI